MFFAGLGVAKVFSNFARVHYSLIGPCICLFRPIAEGILMIAILSVLYGILRKKPKSWEARKSIRQTEPQFAPYPIREKF
jgi:hypothetical protein